MVNAENIFEIIQRYFTDVAVVVLAMLALLFLLKNAEKKYKKYAVLLGILALLVFNDLVYQVVIKIGEADTFYRFLWIVPVTILCGYLIIEIWGAFSKASQKMAYVLLLAIVVFLNYKPSFNGWTDLPENVYQISDEQIEAAKIIRKYKGKWKPKFWDDGTISDGIREYAGYIMLELEPTTEMLAMINNEVINYKGSDIQEIMHEAQIDTIGVKKEYLLAQKLFESAGYKKVGETESSYLYHYKWRDIEKRWAVLEAYYNEAILDINEEYVAVPGVESRYEILYLTDMHIDLSENEYANVNMTSAAEQFKAWVQMANAYEVDAVLLGGNMLDSYSEQNIEFFKEQLSLLEMPYLYIDEEIELADVNVQTLELEELLISGIENSASKEVAEILEAEKPVLVMAHEPFSDKENGRDALLNPDSPVIEILTGGTDSVNKSLLNNKILQYAGAPAYEGTGTLIIIRGDEVSE